MRQLSQSSAEKVYDIKLLKKRIDTYLGYYSLLNNVTGCGRRVVLHAVFDQVFVHRFHALELNLLEKQFRRNKYLGNATVVTRHAPDWR